jgi:hypothetical protein
MRKGAGRGKRPAFLLGGARKNGKGAIKAF